MTQTADKKPAAHWLDVACNYENKGEPKKAQMALTAAIRIDSEEHAANPKAASLPRK